MPGRRLGATVIVLDAQKEFYYRGLKAYEAEPGFLEGTFRSLQDAYYETFEKFIPDLN
ncbi:MAG: hypothetical protein ACK5LO_01145 [Leucobacter sp.]